MHGLPWRDESNELGLVGLAVTGGDGHQQRDLVDGHVRGVVDVKGQFSAAVGDRLGLDPGADLDGLGAAGLLVVKFLALVFLAQQVHGDAERTDGTDRGQQVGSDVEPRGGQHGSAEVGLGAGIEVVLHSHPHGAVHVQAEDLLPRRPEHLTGFAARGRCAAGRAGGEQDGEFLPGLAVAGVEDDVLGVGVDPDQTRYLAVDSGLFPDFANCRGDEGLTEVHGPAGQGPVVVVGAVDDQQRALVVDHDHIRGGDDTIRDRGLRVVVVVVDARHE